MLINAIIKHVSVQQSSFYGLTGMLPARYTQAVMTGESKKLLYYMVYMVLCMKNMVQLFIILFSGFAGLLSSMNRILTKSLIHSKKSSTVLLFSISIFIILTCIYTNIKVRLWIWDFVYCSYFQVQGSVIVNFYKNMCQKQKIVLIPREDVSCIKIMVVTL